MSVSSSSSAQRMPSWKITHSLGYDYTEQERPSQSILEMSENNIGPYRVILPGPQQQLNQELYKKEEYANFPGRVYDHVCSIGGPLATVVFEEDKYLGKIPNQYQSPLRLSYVNDTEAGDVATTPAEQHPGTVDLFHKDIGVLRQTSMPLEIGLPLQGAITTIRAIPLDAEHRVLEWTNDQFAVIPPPSVIMQDETTLPISGPADNTAFLGQSIPKPPVDGGLLSYRRLHLTLRMMRGIWNLDLGIPEDDTEHHKWLDCPEEDLQKERSKALEEMEALNTRFSAADYETKLPPRPPAAVLAFQGPLTRKCRYLLITFVQYVSRRKSDNKIPHWMPPGAAFVERLSAENFSCSPDDDEFAVYAECWEMTIPVWASVFCPIDTHGYSLSILFPLPTAECRNGSNEDLDVLYAELEREYAAKYGSIPEKLTTELERELRMWELYTNRHVDALFLPLSYNTRGHRLLDETLGVFEYDHTLNLVDHPIMHMDNRYDLEDGNSTLQVDLTSTEMSNLRDRREPFKVYIIPKPGSTLPTPTHVVLRLKQWWTSMIVSYREDAELDAKAAGDDDVY